MDIKIIQKEINSYSDKNKSTQVKRFYKIGKGDYAEKDVFIGLSVPLQRSIAKKYYKNINNLSDLDLLMKSKIHEHRMIALFLLINKFNSASILGRRDIFRYYVKNIEYVNNWDLVDSSAPYILGCYLYENPIEKNILYEFIKSEKMFVRRISLVATHYFIKKQDFLDALKLSKILLEDREDLICKAVGWTLREIGKKNLKIETNFLDQHLRKISRTTLRYAIERFEEKKRQKYLKA